MRFDLTDLQLFVHILDSGTLTAAAQRSHLTLASASERVRGMEALLGTALLIRQARGVQPTAAGHTLGQHARQVLSQMQLLRGAMGEFGAGLAGQIRLRGNTSAVREHLPLAVSGFLRQHPQMHWSCRNAQQRSAGRTAPGPVRYRRGRLGCRRRGGAGRPALPALEADPLAAALPLGHALAGRRN
jgi:DNA-binding transcriptional LysR family regulator